MVLAHFRGTGDTTKRPSNLDLLCTLLHHHCIIVLLQCAPAKHSGSVPAASGTPTIYFLGIDASEEFLSKNLIIKSQEMA
jgi:hypothetical protein